MKTFFKILLGLIVVVALGLVARFVYQRMFSSATITVYSFQGLYSGNMESTISATGTVEPEELVNVGAQVGGMITTLGKDIDGKNIDYGSKVRAGATLALIDDALYAAEAKSAEAQLEQAKAAKVNAEAIIMQAKAKLAETIASQKQTEAQYAQLSSAWNREKRLYGSGSSTKSELEKAESEFLNSEAGKAAKAAAVESAKANLAAAEADLLSATAKIKAAMANRDKSKQNWEYCVIKSPVDGVIIDRRVSIGQTVNASMSAPSLFLIAKDLRKMQVWVSVNEADIGQIKVGQKVYFFVDAFPGRKFIGSVQKIRLNATMSQNVVTYVVEIGTDNSDNTLLPYLTANVKFVLDERANVLAVPNAALRYVPQNVPSPQTAPDEKVVWTQDGNKNLVPHIIKTGLNDGMNTEILSGDLTASDNVITGERVVELNAKKTAVGGENPFMAKPPKFGEKKKTP